MSEWNEVKGSQAEKPAKLDVKSSEFYVYERKDITPYEEKDAEDNTLWTGWRYQERKVPREQWQLENAAAQTEYQLEVMGGITDMYELFLEGGM